MFKFIKSLFIKVLFPVEYESPIYIFGFDGVLVASEIASQEVSYSWRSLNRAQLNLPVAATMVALIHCGCDVRVWTGRADTSRSELVYWLSQRMNISEKQISKMLYMRDSAQIAPTSDTELKAIWLRELSNKDHFRIAAVFDHGDGAAHMWRENGITCFQV